VGRISDLAGVNEGDAIYKQIATAVGASTDVADFGDSSELTGPCGGFAFSYNGDGKLIDAAADLGKELPLTLSFKTKVSGEMSSQNLAPCIGNGWVEFEGGFPLATVPGIVGTLFLAGGLIRPAVQLPPRHDMEGIAMTTTLGARRRVGSFRPAPRREDPAARGASDDHRRAAEPLIGVSPSTSRACGSSGVRDRCRPSG
jgi:hypothetical protein